MITKPKPPKQKTCKNSKCKKKFTPVKPMQCVCGFDCAVEHALQLKVKREASEAKRVRKETKVAKLNIKPRSQWLKEAQAVVNKYIRIRDSRLGCCSCDKPSTWDGQWHASHFRSVGAAPSIRFNLWNIHKSCSVCNNWLSGNLSEYEPRLRMKIGNEKVDFLRSSNGIANYEIEYLQRLIKVFKKLCNRGIYKD